MNTTAPLPITVFCSAKGGVGKSSLAFVTARMKADSPGGAVLLDLDLTGTSMIEGLPLLAPDGAGGFRTRADTLQVLDARKYARPDPLALRDPPFTHDVLRDLEDASGYRIETRFWQAEHESETFRVLPSSPLPGHHDMAMGWLGAAHADEWAIRFLRVLLAIRARMTPLPHVVVDLPPGAFGFAQRVVGTVAEPSGGDDVLHLDPRVCVVTTQDRNDLFAAAEWAVRLRPAHPNLTVVVNRLRHETLELLDQAVDDRFSGLVSIREIRRSVAEDAQGFGALFRGAGRVTKTETSDLKAIMEG